MRVDIPNGVADFARRYSSRELIAVIVFAYIALEYNLAFETLKQLASLLTFYLVGQYMVKIAQAVFQKKGK